MNATDTHETEASAMSDKEFSIYEAAKAKGETAVTQALDEIPCSELRQELARIDT